MDIRHFFESVDHDVLKAWLKKKIRDERMLYILELIIDGSEGRVAFRVLHIAVVVKFHVAASRPFHQRTVESGALYPVYG